MTVFGISDRGWIWYSAAFYCAGLLYGLWSLFRRRQPTAGVLYLLAALGFVLQTGGLQLRGLAVHGCPLGNKFEIVQFTVWSLMLLYFFVGTTFRVSVLGFFCSGLAAAMSAVSLAFPGWDPSARAPLSTESPWIAAHAALAMFSYGVFALLAMTSLMYLLQLRNLRQKKVRGLFAILPSIVQLDQINYRLLGFGVAVLTVALGLGAVQFHVDRGGVDHAKVIATVAVWCAYSVALVLRWRERLLNPRFAWAGLVLLAAVLLSLPIINGARLPVVTKPHPEVSHP